MSRAARRGVLWFGVAAPPAAWFLHLVASYVLVGYACRAGSAWPLHLATGMTLALAGSAAALAWRAWRRMDAGEGSPDDGHAEAPGGARFLAASGVGLGVGFTLTIVLAGIPPLVLDPCGL